MHGCLVLWPHILPQSLIQFAVSSSGAIYSDLVLVWCCGFTKRACHVDRVGAPLQTEPFQASRSAAGRAAETARLAAGSRRASGITGGAGACPLCAPTGASSSSGAGFSLARCTRRQALRHLPGRQARACVRALRVCFYQSAPLWCSI